MAMPRDLWVEKIARRPRESWRRVRSAFRSNRGLNGHVQTSGDFGVFSGLDSEFCARTSTGIRFGDFDFFCVPNGPSRQTLIFHMAAAVNL